MGPDILIYIMYSLTHCQTPLSKMRSSVLSSLLLSISLAEEIFIENGKLECDNVNCRVVCDYGFIPSGPYSIPLQDIDTVTCEWPVGLVVGGYNRHYGGDDIYLASTEVYSIRRSDECEAQLPDLPVERKGMFGGKVFKIINCV